MLMRVVLFIGLLVSRGTSEPKAKGAMIGAVI